MTKSLLLAHAPVMALTLLALALLSPVAATGQIAHTPDADVSHAPAASVAHRGDGAIAAERAYSEQLVIDMLGVAPERFAEALEAAARRWSEEGASSRMRVGDVEIALVSELERVDGETALNPVAEFAIIDPASGAVIGLFTHEIGAD